MRLEVREQSIRVQLWKLGSDTLTNSKALSRGLDWLVSETVCPYLALRPALPCASFHVPESLRVFVSGC